VVSKPKVSELSAHQAAVLGELRAMLKIVAERIAHIQGVTNGAKELLQRTTDVFALAGTEYAVDINASRGKHSHADYVESVANSTEMTVDALIRTLKLWGALLAPLHSEIPLRGMYIGCAISDMLPGLIKNLTLCQMTFPKGVSNWKFLSLIVLGAELQAMATNPEFKASRDIFGRALDDGAELPEVDITEFASVLDLLA